MNCKDENNNTPLHHLVMCSNSNTDCKEVLCNLIDENTFVNSECINAQNKLGQTPILLAGLNGDDELITKLLTQGARLDIKDNEGNYLQSEEDSDVEQTDKTFQTADEIMFRNIKNIFNQREVENLSTLRDMNDIVVEKQPVDFISEYFKNFINATKNKVIIDRTPNPVVYAKVREWMLGPNDQISIIEEENDDQEDEREIHRSH
jgi:ankyrin repeat protein